MPFGSAGGMQARRSWKAFFCLYAKGTQVLRGVSLMNMTIKIEI